MSTNTEQPPAPAYEIEADGLAGDIIKSIMTPGYTASGVIRIMFYAFYALFATLLFMIFITRGNPHVIALFLLALCLFVTIKWFIAELDHVKKQEAAAKAKRDKKTG
ncbi:decapping endonuclease targeting mRNA [Mucor velutinosus]|uniref:Decapping endonuclease targeting mRNA n=1 Tax=Mucor velutinosus TaxID=708070 RepID=A0AAN7HNE0_9FUNG|nr:decapping endonuclease targeting mRNA [Mucor velutinosus]